MRTTLSFLLLLTACDGAKIGGDDTSVVDDSDADTDTDTDTDTDADADTDSDTDTDTDTDVERTALTFVPSADSDADAVQLDWLDIDDENPDGGFFVNGSVGAAFIEDGVAVIEAATPAEEDLLFLADGLYGRYAIPSAFVDEDGDGEHDDDEEIRGAGTTWALYITGEIPFEYAALGIVDGWNALEIIQDTSPVIHDTDAIPLPMNLIPDVDITIAGTMDYDIDGTPRLAVINGQALETGRLGYIMYDQALASPWEVTLSSAAYEDHLFDITGTGLYAAIEVPIAYNDANGDGEIDDGEPLGPACSNEYVAGLLWIAPPTEPVIAYYLQGEGWYPQWIPFREDPDTDDLVPLTEEESMNLLISESCAF